MPHFFPTLLLFLLLALPVISHAKPVNEEQKIATDFRRTTLLVNDMDNALSLYRDVLGLKVIYDQVIESPLENKPGEIHSRRLVLLRANDNFIGVLGLLHYIHPKKPQRQERFDEPVPGDPILVINTTDFETIWPQVVKTEGVQVIDVPETIKYPRKGGGSISVIQTMIRDPNGYWIEINKILSAPATDTDG